MMALMLFGINSTYEFSVFQEFEDFSHIYINLDSDGYFSFQTILKVMQVATVSSNLL